MFHRQACSSQIREWGDGGNAVYYYKCFTDSRLSDFWGLLECLKSSRLKACILILDESIWKLWYLYEPWYWNWKSLDDGDSGIQGENFAEKKFHLIGRLLKSAHGKHLSRDSGGGFENLMRVKRGWVGWWWLVGLWINKSQCGNEKFLKRW